MSLRHPPAGAPAPADETPGTPAVGASVPRVSATAPIWSVLLIRLASSAGGVVIGLYLAYLYSLGQQITSVTVGLVAVVFYLTELTLTPVLGALSDRYGRWPVSPYVASITASRGRLSTRGCRCWGWPC